MAPHPDGLQRRFRPDLLGREWLLASRKLHEDRAPRRAFDPGMRRVGVPDEHDDPRREHALGHVHLGRRPQRLRDDDGKAHPGPGHFERHPFAEFGPGFDDGGRGSGRCPDHPDLDRPDGQAGGGRSAREQQEQSRHREQEDPPARPQRKAGEGRAPGGCSLGEQPRRDRRRDSWGRWVLQGRAQRDQRSLHVGAGHAITHRWPPLAGWPRVRPGAGPGDGPRPGTGGTSRSPGGCPGPAPSRLPTAPGSTGTR